MYSEENQKEAKQGDGSAVDHTKLDRIVICAWFSGSIILKLWNLLPNALSPKHALCWWKVHQVAADLW